MARGVPPIKSRRGVRPKASYKRELELAQQGLMPLDYMLQLLRNTRFKPVFRFEIAKAAAPYCHPKLAQISTNGSNTLTIRVEGGLPPMPGSQMVLPNAGGVTIEHSDDDE